MKRSIPEEFVRVAFIGASHWHLGLYLEPLLEVSDIEIVGFSDPDAARAAALAARYGTASDGDYRALCRDTRPDFVFALGRHVDMVEEASFLIDAKIPFALEKPCGLNERDVVSIANKAERTGAFAAVPLVFRNGDFAKHLLEMNSGEGIQYATFRFIAGFAARYQQAGCDWMLDPRLSGGGCTINLAVHFFDLCLSLFGPNTRVLHAAMSNAAWRHPVEDYSAVTFEQGGRLCVVETGYLYPAPTSTFDMHFAMRSPSEYLIAPAPETVEVFDSAGNRRIWETHTTNVGHYRTFVFDVIDRVRKGNAPLASLSAMIPVMKLVDDAYRKAGPLPY